MQSERTSQRPNDLVVYTTIMGGNYTLPMVSRSSNVEYICFTDQQYFEENGWKVIEIKPILPNDLPRSSREPKICPHRFLSEFERSIYIDPSVELLQDPVKIWNSVVPDGAFVSAFYHSFRESLIDEFIAVFDQQLDSSVTIAEQFNAYSRLGSTDLNQRPVWGGFLLRRHNEKNCITAMETWFAHVLRYSRRDQLSLPLILGSIDSDRKSVTDLDAYKSDFHRWPREGYARPSNYKETAKPTLFPPQFQLRQAEIQIESLEQEVTILRSATAQSLMNQNETDFRITTLQNELSASSKDLITLNEAINDLRKKIHLKNQRIENLVSELSATRRSKSYRFANFLAKLFLPLKRIRK